ncbi:hypothetical protein [Streptomyces sp. HNM0575]|uniref:hypothetical protein n=1 Tax=Streptomyces sp. HNM0575 TaxID=2716338 RepID=UPI0019D14FBF|nr:hypothetical protein [Streptomyces sp. HNM0575]
MNRHRFEPSRLLLGLLLVGTALTYAMDALGEWRVPVWALLALVPLSLVAAAFVALLTFAVRRAVRRRQRASARREPLPVGAPVGTPVDEPRDGYEQPGGGGGRTAGEGPGEGEPGGGRSDVNGGTT